jgi:hypothetical protein
MTLAVKLRLQPRSNLSIVSAISGKSFAPVLRKQPRAGANARFAICMQQSQPPRSDPRYRQWRLTLGLVVVAFGLRRLGIAG